MKAAMFLAVVVAAVTVSLANAAGDVVTSINTCASVDQSKCTINELRVHPCNFKKGGCNLRLGRDYNLSFDFTPNFAATQLKTAAYNFNNPVGMDLIFSDLGIADACLYSTCPTTPGTQNTFSYNLHIGKFLPRGTFSLRWLVWNAENESEKCCFETKVILK